MKNRIVFFFFLIQGFSVPAQTLSIPNVEVCAAQEVLLPVTGTSLSNMGALTLFIGFDPALLSYDTVLNVNPQLAGMSINLMTSLNQLACAWSSLTPINITNDKLFDIRLVTNGLSAPVTFNPGCEIADPSGTVIPTLYLDGAVNSGLPLIGSHPENTVVPENTDVHFTVSSPNALAYSWIESQDQGTSWLTLEDDGRYSGTQTPELTIFQVPISFNQYRYRCTVVRGTCQSVSESATLLVDPIPHAAGAPAPGFTDIQVSPMPFRERARVEFMLPMQTSAKLQVFTVTGTPVFRCDMPDLTEGLHHIIIQTGSWKPGIYLIKLTHVRSGVTHDQLLRVIKTDC